MAQRLQNYSPVMLAGSANKLLNFSLTASYAVLQSNQRISEKSVAPREAGEHIGQSCIVYWAFRVISLTRNDWIKQGCRIRKEEKLIKSETMHCIF